MAKAIHLTGGTKGKKNTLARANNAQKSVSGSKAKNSYQTSSQGLSEIFAENAYL